MSDLKFNTNVELLKQYNKQLKDLIDNLDKIIKNQDSVLNVLESYKTIINEREQDGEQ